MIHSVYVYFSVFFPINYSCAAAFQLRVHALIIMTEYLSGHRPNRTFSGQTSEFPNTDSYQIASSESVRNQYTLRNKGSKVVVSGEPLKIL